MTILAPLDEAGFTRYMAVAIPRYASEKVASGEWREAQSLELARAAFTRMLPEGLATPGNFLFELREGAAGSPIGLLWFAVQERAGQAIAYVYEVEVMPEHRRKGHARRAFQALESRAAELGLAGIALHVFGHNSGARQLYEDMGYRATNISMFKPLPADEA